MGTQTVTFNVTNDFSLSMREIRSCGINTYNLYPDSNGNPRGIDRADTVVWEATLDVTTIPDKVWSSNDNPPRYRFGMVRTYHRNRFCESSFLTEPKTEFEQYTYTADVPYLDNTIRYGSYPDIPSSDINPYQYGNYTDRTGDRIVINLIPGVTAQLVVRYLFLPAYFTYFI